MAATTPPSGWVALEQWLHTVTGQEFCDELVWGTVGEHTLDALLRENRIPQNVGNRAKLINLADKIMANDGA